MKMKMINENEMKMTISSIVRGYQDSFFFFIKDILSVKNTNKSI